MRTLTLGVSLLLCPALAGAQTVSYTVSMPKPTSSLLHVAMEIRGAAGPSVDVAMPAWSPGAYSLHWAAKNVTALSATDGAGTPLEARMVDTSMWRIRPSAPVIRVRYQVYLGPTTMNDAHATINGTRTLMYVVGKSPYPAPGALTLAVDAPAGWKLATGLDEIRPGVFGAPDYDTLVDAPIEASPNLEVVTFDDQGAHYEIVIDGRNDFDKDRMREDLRKMVAEHVRMMGGAPYRRYVFLLHGTNGTGTGGLEHLNSTAISFGRYASTNRDHYNTFLSVMSHEYFHLWNVKRIRPAILGPFDYSRPQHTRNLYVCEGLTDYYDDLALVRAGVWDRPTFYAALAKAIQQLQTQPGHLVTSAEMSSFLTWNRPDNGPNVSISYYTKGDILGVLLDLELRARTANRRTLDDVLRMLMAEHGLPKPGFAEDDGFRSAVEKIAVAGGATGDFGAFFRKYVSGLDEIDYDAYLRHAGLKLDIALAPPVRSIGVTTRTDADRLIVDNVPPSGAGYDAGLMPGDVLLAMDDERVLPATWAARLAMHKAGDTVRLQVMRGDRLVTVSVALQEDRAPTYRIVEDPGAAAAARALRDRWLAASER